MDFPTIQHACSRRHHLFFGQNALRQAIAFAETGRLVKVPYEYRTRLNTSVCWGIEEANTAYQAKHSHVGNGVHAKMYKLVGGGIILSSQNNGSSPLFEFAVYYPPSQGSKLDAIFDKAVSSARGFSKWFSRNKNWMLGKRTGLKARRV